MENNIHPTFKMELQGYEAETIELWRQGVTAVNNGEFGVAEQRFAEAKEVIGDPSDYYNRTQYIR